MPMTIAQLRAELAAKEKQVSKLRAERKKITKQLAALDGKIAALGGGPAKRKPKRKKRASKKVSKKAAKKTVASKKPGRKKRSLADVLAKVLLGKGNVKVADAAKLASAAGYKSASSQFGNIVSQALSTDKRFKKLSRGVYTLKGAQKAAVGKSRKKVAKKAAKKIARKAPKKASKKAPKKASKKFGSAVTKPLTQYLVEALSKPGAALRAMDLAVAVRKAGYSTQDKNFKQTVAGKLGTDGRFERVDRGVYKLAGKK